VDLDGRGEVVSGIVVMRQGEKRPLSRDRSAVKARLAELAPSTPSRRERVLRPSTTARDLVLSARTRGLRHD
jgi:hypothetical protein